MAGLTYEYLRTTSYTKFYEILVTDGVSQFTLLIDFPLIHFFTEQKIIPSSKFQVEATNQVAEGQILVTSLKPLSFHENFTPLRLLTPFNEDFIIKARVLYKSAVKRQAEGGPKSFYLILIDAEGVELRAQFTADFPLIDLQKVYIFTNGKVRCTSPQTIELIFTEESIIVPTKEDTELIPTCSSSLVSIQALKSLPFESVVDVVGLILDIGPLVTVHTPRGSLVPQRKLEIGDASGASIEVTLWNDLALTPELDQAKNHPKPIILVKQAVLTNFNKRSLSSRRQQTMLFFESAWSPEFFSLTFLNWPLTIYDFTPLSIRKTDRFLRLKPLAFVKEEIELFETEKEYEVFGYVKSIQHDCFRKIYYQSCKRCKKKVGAEEGKFRCFRCGTLESECNFAYSARVSIEDCTAFVNAVVFDLLSSILFGLSASEAAMLDEWCPDELERILSVSVFSPFLFKVQAIRQAGNRIEYKLKDASPVDPLKIATAMLTDIKEAISK